MMTGTSQSYTPSELCTGPESTYQLNSSVSNNNTRVNANGVTDTLFEDVDYMEELNPGLSIHNSHNEPHESVSSDMSLESPRSAQDQDTVVPHIMHSNNFPENYDMLDYIELGEPTFNYVLPGNNSAQKFETPANVKKEVTPSCLDKNSNYNDTVDESFGGEGGKFTVEGYGESLAKYESMDDDAFTKELFSSPPTVIEDAGKSKLIKPHQVPMSSFNEYNHFPSVDAPSSTGYGSDGSVVDPLLSFDMHHHHPGPQVFGDSDGRSATFNPLYHQSPISHISRTMSMPGSKEDLDKGLGIYLSQDADLENESAISVRRDEPLVGVDNLHLKFNYPHNFLGAHDMMSHYAVGGNAHEMLRGADHGNKSQSISKMPLAQMYAMMGLAHNHNLAKEREERVINIVRAEGFNVGSQTWIRDTEETERFRIINSILYQCKSWGYDKSLIEIIVRRGTYSRMQSKLRQERRMKKRTMDATGMKRYPHPSRSMRYSQAALQHHLHQQYLRQQQHI